MKKRLFRKNIDIALNIVFAMIWIPMSMIDNFGKQQYAAIPVMVLVVGVFMLMMHKHSRMWY